MQLWWLSPDGAYIKRITKFKHINLKTINQEVIK